MPGAARLRERGSHSRTAERRCRCTSPRRPFRPLPQSQAPPDRLPLLCPERLPHRPCRPQPQSQAPPRRFPLPWPLPSPEQTKPLAFRCPELLNGSSVAGQGATDTDGKQRCLRKCSAMVTITRLRETLQCRLWRQGFVHPEHLTDTRKPTATTASASSLRMPSAWRRTLMRGAFDHAPVGRNVMQWQRFLPFLRRSKRRGNLRSSPAGGDGGTLSALAESPATWMILEMRSTEGFGPLRSEG